MENIFTVAIENTGLASYGIFFLLLISSYIVGLGLKNRAWVLVSGGLVMGYVGFMVTSLSWTMGLGWIGIWAVLNGVMYFWHEDIRG